jgi:hypothetical protein
MGQIKGQTGNPYGRAKGSKNKTTIEKKKELLIFMNKKYKDFDKAWKTLEPIDKVRTYISMLKYVIPPLSAVKVEEDNEDDIIQKILDNQK